MNDHELEQKVAAAFCHGAPDVLDEILADCGEQTGKVIQFEKKNRGMRAFLAAAACLVLLLTGVFGVRGYRLEHTVAAAVSLDVNPSVEIRVNQRERVLAVLALNEDGKAVIGDMDFSGSTLEVTVNALIGSMVRNGYLNELANSILISVDGKNEAACAALRQRLTEEVAALLNGDGAVLSQTVARDTELEALAAQYGISLGKAQLIRGMAAEDDRYSCEELAGMNINDLNLLGHHGHNEHLSCVGDASTKAYIGAEQARDLALAHAKVAASAVRSWEAELENDHGEMVYEVEFSTDTHEYEYKIHAVTGEVLAHEWEAEEQPAPTAPAQTGTCIGEEKAREAACRHAGVKASEVLGWDVCLARKSGEQVYDVEFKTEAYEYEYTIHALTGAVMAYEREAREQHHDSDHHETRPAETTPPALVSACIGEAKAKELAYSHAGVSASQVRSCKTELEREDGVLVYEVEFKTENYEYEYTLNAATGAVLEYERESCEAPTTPTTTPELISACIGEAKAKELAYSHAGVSASQVRSCKAELEREDGVLVYEVEFKTDSCEYEYRIHAVNGSVVSWERESHDHSGHHNDNHG